MEFEDIQAIWDTQNNKPMYALNEQALHNRIVSKKHQAASIATYSEWVIIISSVLSGIVSVWVNQSNIMLYVVAVWMFACAVYALAGRIRRLNDNQRFDRSMHGDLQHALATAHYQVRLSHIMRWNIIPVGVLIVASFWESGKPVWISIITLLFMLLVFYASKWELNIYKRKKRELEVLLNKLQH